jgi:GT2 family glycosyltransferase
LKANISTSVIVPAHNAEGTIRDLLDSLFIQKKRGYEVIVVDDCSSDQTAEIAGSYPCKLIRLRKNRGPAYSRNIGAKAARGNILAFTDSDCKVAADWVESINNSFSDNETDAVMGRLVLMPSNTLGDSISCLGFPAGGAIGFDKIWRVDENGFTDSLSTCNCAIRKEAFWDTSGFDETFPTPSGDDVFLAYKLRRANCKIRYCPEIVAFHPARSSFKSFVKWHYTRGKGSYTFANKVTNKRYFVSLRMWSSKNIVKHCYKDIKFPLIMSLYFISFVIQIAGFAVSKYFMKERA